VPSSAGRFLVDLARGRRLLLLCVLGRGLSLVLLLLVLAAGGLRLRLPRRLRRAALLSAPVGLPLIVALLFPLVALVASALVGLPLLLATLFALLLPFRHGCLPLK
jgi:hypothetical protein